MRVRGLAMLYACGVALAAPVTLEAAETATKIEQVQEAPAPEQPAQMTPAQPAAAAPEPKPKPRVVAAAPGSVRMLDFSFSPAAITVNAGESVTWVNAGEEPHNAVGDGFSTALLKAGQSGSKSFASAGTFSYICTVHPQMKGTVKVVAAQRETQPETQTPAGTQDSGSEDDTAVSADASAADGPQLANSGLDAWLLGLVGMALLAAGMSIRRRAV